ncbi:MAG: isochorismate synthase [Burkholderiales bacterium]|jgi:menaquinone-specific isochorismate synthase|nr:isochorismate synthase [Burkholderiales bacterium]
MNASWFDTLKTAIADQLRSFLNSAPLSTDGIITLSATCDASMTPEMLLSLLHVQSDYPKLFWMPRDTDHAHGENKGDHYCATVGAVKIYNNIDSAMDSAAHHGRNRALHPDLRLWGINAFPLPASDAQKGIHDFWFLPRFEWRVLGQTLTLFCHIASQSAVASNIISDAHEALAALDCLTPPVGHLPDFDHHGSLDQVLPDRRAWNTIITRALAMIDTEQFKKVVPARRVAYTFEHDVSPESVVAESLIKNRHCYHFMIAFSSARAFLGATPERLFRREGQTLLTEALAGTTKNAANHHDAQQLANALKHDPKNVHEHQFVIDDITERLSEVTDTLNVSPMEVVRLRNIQHLRSTITAHLSNADDALCVRRLQPTAAVAGLPRAAALKFIAMNEPFPREWYAGSIGYHGKDDAEFAVTLRSALIDRNRVFFYAGCGIVEGSNDEEEWQELNNKTAALGSLFSRSWNRGLK